MRRDLLHYNVQNFWPYSWSSLGDMWQCVLAGPKLWLRSWLCLMQSDLWFPSTSQLQGQIYIGRKGSVGRSTSTWVLREMQKQKEGKLNIDFLVQSHWVVVQGKNKLYIHALRYTNHRQFRLISNTVSLVPHKLIWGTVAWPYFQMECTWLCSGTMKTKEALGLPASWGSMA